jgi:hypothetical protein
LPPSLSHTHYRVRRLGCGEILDGFWVILAVKARSWVEGEVMVDKLAEEGKACWKIRVVGVLCASWIHEAARLAESQECRPHLGVIRSEARERREKSTKLAQLEVLRSGRNLIPQVELAVVYHALSPHKYVCCKPTGTC